MKVETRSPWLVVFATPSVIVHSWERICLQLLDVGEQCRLARQAIRSGTYARSSSRIWLDAGSGRYRRGG